MASVVFMRGVNVGGHKAFRPSSIVEPLRALEVASIGAAGTFVVRADASADEIRRAFARALPFEAPLMICSDRDLGALLKADPFSGASEADGQFISILERRPAKNPPLPLNVPEGREWMVALIAVRGCFVASLMRRLGSRMLYPNEVVEKRLGIAATTRGWPTFLKLREALEKSAPPAPRSAPRTAAASRRPSAAARSRAPARAASTKKRARSR
jgi:uncharacterized protein (DUF1697 family)